MINKSRLACLVTVFAVFLLSLSLFAASAQYQTQQTSNVTVSSDGVAHVDQTSTAGNLSIDISGSPGATGSVSTETYTSNPQPDASVPANVALTHFVAVTFNMDASTFNNATITLHYTDNDVQGLASPYTIYKYIPGTNSFVVLPTMVDTTAKTLTCFVSSVTDPLLAIGNAQPTTSPTPRASWPAVTPTSSPQTTATPTSSSVPTWTWMVMVIAIIAIVAVVYLLIKRRS